MAKYSQPKLPEARKTRRVRRVIIPEADIDIELKDPWLAAFLAWLIPGLGHLYQGRTAKGWLFMICILGTFFFGLYMSDGHAVYASLPNQQPYRWQYWCQLGAGAPALPALVQRERIKRGSEPLFGGAMAPPRDPHIVREYDLKESVVLESKDASGNVVKHPTELAKWNHDLPSRFEMGGVFAMVAGLLNILVIYDAFAGPLVILPAPKKKKPDDDEDKPEEANGESTS